MKFQSQKIIGLGLVFSFASGGQILAKEKTESIKTKPNIIFILADDLGYGDLGCYGQKKIQTPNIDKLASEGMRFTQAYAGSTVCAPSRCSLMTGFHNGHNRIRDNIPHEIFLQPDDFTIAELLKQAGYTTGGIGKWSLGNPGSWGVPIYQGFDYYYGPLNQDLAQDYYPDHLWENDKEVLLLGNRGEKKKEYLSDFFTGKAIDFINKNAQKPFFLYLPYTIPHYSDYEANEPDYYIVPSDEPYTKKEWPQIAKNEAAMIARLDNDIGKIMKLVKDLGIEENTIIIFTSDNGPITEGSQNLEFFDSNSTLKGGKRDMYEGGIRVPFIVKWENSIKEETQSDEIICFWDIMPTFAELVNYPSEIKTDGISFLSVLTGNEKGRKEHEYLYWDYGHTRSTFLQAVRYGKYKGIANNMDNQITYELYDLEKDMGENHNIATEHPETMDKIKEYMSKAYVFSEAFPRKITHK